MSTETKSCSFIDKHTRSLAMCYLSDLDTPVSLGLYLALKHGDDVLACSHEIDPANYNDSEKFGRDYFAVMLLSKYQVGDKSLVELRKQRALDKFWACEEYLRSRMGRLEEVLHGHNPLDHDLASVFYRARGKIAQILGPVSEAFDINACDFGPGSSTSVPRSKAHPSAKYIAADVTSSCAPFLRWFSAEMGFSLVKTNLRESSRINIVPKNFKIDRVIACEPDWNIFFQKGVGAAIRSRLRKFGLDLNYAHSLNGDRAREGSLTGKLATIDLSSASDSVSTKLVRFLLPDDWFYLCNSLRTSAIDVDGEVRQLIKFSSMGNGFTFELESLIFYTLAQAVVEDETARAFVSVYGDDIIIPTDCVERLTDVLEVAGFRLNSDKSYSSGYFRESCGAHYFGGRDVKPFYLKREVTTDAEKFRFCNSIQRLAGRFYGCRIDDSPWKLSYSACKRSIRRVFHIPEGYGDGGLVRCFDEVCPSTKRKRDGNVHRYQTGIEGFRVRCLLPVSKKATSTSIGMHVAKMRSLMRKHFGYLERQPTGCLPGSLVRTLLGNDTELISNHRPAKKFAGNEIDLHAADVKWRVGTIHVPVWVDPQGA